MPYVDSVIQACENIRRHPLRSLLTGLAMAAAVAATAVILTGTNGLATAARQTSARAFGTNTFIIARVFGAGLNRKDLADKLARHPNVTSADLRFLERHAGEGIYYAAVAQRSAQVTSGGRTFEGAAVSGASATLAEIRDIGVERGRFLTRDDETRAAPVAIIGWSVADRLFPGQDPLGRAIRIGGRGFTVIGIQTRQGTAGGVSLDQFVWIPYPMFERVFGSSASLQIFARATDPARTAFAEERARAGMRARRHLQPGAADNFDLLTPEAARQFVATVTERVGAAGPPISVMALLAAIIVVANTTFVSVTERTREIGVRRAVGATARQILLEVLAESSLVALAGGVAGLAVASLVLRAAADAFDVPLPLDLSTIAASTGAAALSGILAGWLPARRAAALEIVTALHTE